jgi:hypothetical protein
MSSSSTALVKIKKQSNHSNNCYSNCDGNCDNRCPCGGNCNKHCGCQCGDNNNNCCKNNCQCIMCGSKAGGDLTGEYPDPRVRGLRGIEIAKIYPQIGQGLFFDGQFYSPSFGGSTTPSGLAGGDLGGTYPNPTVVKLQGFPLAPGSPGLAGQVLTWNGAIWLAQFPSAFTGAAGGDLAGSYPNPGVVRINGHNVSGGTPSNGDVLTWSTVNNQWQAGSGIVGPAGQDLRGTYPNPFVQGLQGYGVSSVAPLGGQVMTWNAITMLWTPTNPPSGADPIGPASGDLGGAYPNPVVVGLRSIGISATLPSSGQVLTFFGGQWTPMNISLSGSASGDVSGPYSGILTVQGIQNHLIIGNPSSMGQFLFYNSSSTNFNYSAAIAPSVGQVPTWNGAQWQPQNSSSGLPPGVANQVLGWGGSSWVATTLTFTGDLTGTYPSPTVARINGIPVSAVIPSLGQVLTFNGFSWAPAASAGGLPPASANGLILMNSGVSTNWVTSSAALSPPVAGNFLGWNVGLNSWVPMTPTLSGSASGDVTGNYAGLLTVARIDGIPVTNVPFVNGYVLTLVGGIWTPQPSAGGPPSGAAGGDLLGSSYPNPTISRIQGTIVSAGAPVNGDVLTVVGGQWIPQPPVLGPPAFYAKSIVSPGVTYSGSFIPTFAGIFQVNVYGVYKLIEPPGNNSAALSFTWTDPLIGVAVNTGEITINSSTDSLFFNYSIVIATTIAGIIFNVNLGTVPTSNQAQVYVIIEQLQSGV